MFTCSIGLYCQWLRVFTICSIAAIKAAISRSDLISDGHRIFRVFVEIGDCYDVRTSITEIWSVEGGSWK